ncbi:MAG TPA: TMEM175 family protein [Actinomycetes bacterium]|nr:TMEM175 family protein [Actinomycetes bacterium]
MPPPIRYPRQGENLDFGRVVFFTDAVFAIAMTLLVVEVGVPEAAGDATDDPGALLDLLQNKVPLVVAFFIGCFGSAPTGWPTTASSPGWPRSTPASSA